MSGAQVGRVLAATAFNVAVSTEFTRYLRYQPTFARSPYFWSEFSSYIIALTVLYTK